jgi:hypothetical protein
MGHALLSRVCCEERAVIGNLIVQKWGEFANVGAIEMGKFTAETNQAAS